MSHPRIILFAWPLWALFGAGVGFCLSRNVVDVHDGANKDDRRLNVVVCGLSVHQELSGPDSVWRRARIWGAATAATLTIVGAAAAIALRAILIAMFWPPKRAESPAWLPSRTTITEFVQTVFSVALLSYLVVAMASGLYGLLFPGHRLPIAMSITLIAVPPITVIAFIAAERHPRLGLIVRRIGQGIAILYLIIGAIAGLTMTFLIIG